MQNSDQKPVIEFAVITNNRYRMELGREYQNAHYQSYEATLRMMKNTRSVKKYLKVTVQILGFHPDGGQIFFGLE
jgi:hypothetical protein